MHEAGSEEGAEDHAPGRPSFCAVSIVSTEACPLLIEFLVSSAVVAILVLAIHPHGNALLAKKVVDERCQLPNLPVALPPQVWVVTQDDKSPLAPEIRSRLSADKLGMASRAMREAGSPLNLTDRSRPFSCMLFR
jgi:hypothetical protein